MFYALSREMFGLFIRLLFRLRVHKSGELPKAPFIVVSNHASLLDPPLVGLAVKPMPVDFMAKKELFTSRIFGGWTRRVRCIPVDRDSSGAGSLKESLRRLAKGSVVGVFPEGTRDPSGEVRPAKKGVGFLLAKAKVPLLPVYIKGSGDAFFGGSIHPGCAIDVFVGEAVSFEELFSSLDKDDIYGGMADEITRRLRELKDRSESEIPLKSNDL